MRSGVYHAIAGLAESGNDVIVDDVIFDSIVLKEAVHTLYNLNVLFIGVFCPLEVAERRERDLGDLVQDLVRAHYDLVHSHGTYDFTVDTSALSTMKCEPIA